MTHEQESHLDRIKTQALAMIDSKYRRGQAEHGGNIWDQNKNLLDNAIEEAIDMVVYLLSEKEKRNTWDARVEAINKEMGWNKKGDNFPFASTL